MLNKFLRGVNIKTTGRIADVLILNMAFLLSYYFRYGNIIDMLQNDHQLILLIFVNLAWVIIVPILKTYKEDRPGYNISNLVYKLLVTLFVHISLLSLLWLALKDHSFSRLRLLYFYSFFFSSAAIFRIFGTYILRILRRKGYFQRYYAVVGSSKTNGRITNYFRNHPELGYRCIGVYNIQEESASKIISHLESSQGLHSVYLELEMTIPEIWESFSSKFNDTGIKLKIVADFSSFINEKISVDYHDYLPILSVNSTDSVTDRNERWIKRGFDIAFSITALCLGFPIFCLLFLLTILSSPGPAIYSSNRIGRYGKTFKMYKFRSMVYNADDIARKELGGDFHSRGADDPRITRWGFFMRKTRLDELPQFWNVLLGDMSIVGPRPLPKYDVDMLIAGSEDKFHRILMMKPGLTSLGQLRVGYATSSEENILRMNVDLLYHRKFSLTTDLWLILQTARLMLHAKGK